MCATTKRSMSLRIGRSKSLGIRSGTICSTRATRGPMIQNRSFLEQVIPKLDLPAAAETTALEYGCGTGPAACFLAARDFQVDAIDLIPEAITLARRMAEERGVRVAFSVADICALAS